METGDIVTTSSGRLDYDSGVPRRVVCKLIKLDGYLGRIQYLDLSGRIREQDVYISTLELI